MEDKNLESITENIDDKVQAASVTDENLMGDMGEEALREEQADAASAETYKEMSPFRLVMRRFFRSKLSIVGLIMIVFLFLFSFLCPEKEYLLCS